MNKFHDSAVCVFTSFTFSYLNRARVLAQSVKKHHPDWKMHAVVTDHAPPDFTFDLDSEPFDKIVYAEDLEIPSFEQVIFMRNIVEACTAVKGAYFEHLFREDWGKVIYLDPDIALFSSIDVIADALNEYDIALTPHQIIPEKPTDKRAIMDNEIGSLKHGTYNLGFLAVRNSDTGKAFAAWWNARLLDFCFDDIPNGLFTDQRWCDLIPSFFEGVKILRDPGMNVASWNLSHRKLSFEPDGRLLVNGSELKFYHFTKLGEVGDTMTQRYAQENLPVYELWNWYKLQVVENTEDAIPKGWWHFGVYDDQSKIRDEHRRLYKSRVDLRNTFQNPYDVTAKLNFKVWLERAGEF